jgi:hypothetical protein
MTNTPLHDSRIRARLLAMSIYLLVSAFGMLAITVNAATPATTPADRLLSLAKTPTTASAAQIMRETNSLLAQLKVPAWMPERYALIWQWDVKAAGHTFQSQSEDHVVIVSTGAATIKNVHYCVIIVDGDVTIESGAGLLVIANGNIKFSHNPDREWSGVFITKGRLVTPWAASMVVYARNGAEFKSNSVGILAFNTEIRGKGPVDFLSIGGAPIFSDLPPQPVPITQKITVAKPEPLFAGERCAEGAPISEIAQRVPPLARTQATCPDISLLIATCQNNGSAKDREELWTVHICKNQIAEILAKRVAGRTEFSVFNRLPAQFRSK